jgi:hypothetical protein
MHVLNRKIRSFKIESAVSLAEVDSINDFDSFVDCYEANTPANIRENWNRFKVVVDQNMRVVVFSGDTEVEHRELDWILPNSKLEQWSQLHRILEYYKAKPAIMEKSNSFHFIKQALESLNKVTENREVIDPIKSLLEIALNRVDQASDIAFETVKLEPIEREEISFEEPEFEGKVEVMDDEESSVHQDNCDFEPSGGSNIDNMKKEIKSLDQVETLKKSKKSGENRIIVKRGWKKKLDNLIEVECAQCRKKIAKGKLRGHIRACHVSFRLNFDCKFIDCFFRFIRKGLSGAIAAAKATCPERTCFSI